MFLFKRDHKFEIKCVIYKLIRKAQLFRMIHFWKITGGRILLLLEVISIKNISDAILEEFCGLFCFQVTRLNLRLNQWSSHPKCYTLLFFLLKCYIQIKFMSQNMTQSDG